LRTLGLAWDISLPKLPKFGKAKVTKAAVPFKPVVEETVRQEALGD
jgi:hypothetical protein